MKTMIKVHNPIILNMISCSDREGEDKKEEIGGEGEWKKKCGEEEEDKEI